MLLAACIGPSEIAAAHDIPADATVHILVKPAAGRLRILVRLPLKTIRDVEFPERDGRYLDMEKFAPLLNDIAKVWIAGALEIEENESRLTQPAILATQLSYESDRSFASFDAAFAHINGPKLAPDSNVVWSQLLFDVSLDYPIRSENSKFAIRPNLERLAARTVTELRFFPPGEAVRAYEFIGDPGLVPLDPRWHQAALRFVQLGFFHILDGTDHLLFLLCLAIPLRRLELLVLVITAFTAAHSLTLIASAYGAAPGALWFPPLIETLIAVSIVYMALENIVGGNPARRWIIAFGFGLVHGFGFSFALRENLQFAGSHLAASLLSFNIGVELGQLLVLAILIPALAALFRYVVAERMGTIILSAIVAHTGWHWMLDRGAILAKFQRPSFDAESLAGAMRWLIAIVILAGIVRALSWIPQRLFTPQAQRPQPPLP